MRIECCLVLAASLAASGAGFDAHVALKLFVSRFEAKYRSCRTLRASFLERYSENGRPVRLEAGTVYFRRPGKMRWEYESPEKDLFLVDGKSAWFYVPADHTVTRVPAKESTDWRTPLALLAGEMRVSRVCESIAVAEEEQPESLANAILLCTLRGTKAKESSHLPAGDQRVQPTEAVYLEVVKSTGELVRVLIKSAGNVALEFRFSNWQSDPRIADSLFRFSVPPGVAIVNGELAPGQNAVNP